MNLEDVVRSTLAPFSDPATELGVAVTGENTVTARFTRRGTESFVSVLQDAERKLWVTPEGEKRQPIAAFLASERMAGLDNLARVQARLYEGENEGVWVAGPAADDLQHYDNALDQLRELSLQQGTKTRIVILDGAAGVGKTTVVKKLAASMARDFLARQSPRVAMIVSSHGRRLSRLNDAIAATLQDLRVELYYPEVPVLIRWGLLTLVIDGFDELVNQDGYDDAWSSLGELLDSVSGGGVMVLSSRDTFFDEQEFVKRARNESAWTDRLEFRFLRLTNWSRRHVKQLFDRLGVPDEASTSALDLFAESSSSALGRPFFARSVAERLVQPNWRDVIDRLLPIIVEAFVARECNLLFGDEHASFEQHLWSFFEELALEMRRQERDWLELDTVQFFLDAVLEDAGVPVERRRQIVHRAGAVAFLEALETDKGRVRRGFPHEIIRDTFYARNVLRALDGARTAEVDAALGLGVFGLDLADVAAETCRWLGIKDVPACIQRLIAIAQGQSPYNSGALNAAALAFALMRALPSSAGAEVTFTLNALQVGHASLAGGVAPGIRLLGCNIGFLDLSDTRATRFAADQATRIARLRVSTATVLGPDWRCRPDALERFTQSGTLEVLRQPDAIQTALQMAGVVPVDEPTNVPLTRGEALLDYLARRWVRRFFLDEADYDDEPEFKGALWPRLREILFRHNRMTVKSSVEAKGRSKSLLHMRDPRSMLSRSHTDPIQQREIIAAWNEARAL